jgi:serine/threonine-protein kinase
VPVSRLGGGASGEVWQASDSQSGAAVAYKLVVPAALPTPVAVDRTLRELRQLQRASSPRIVKVIDFGKTPEGQVFVASELAEGEPLDQVLAKTGPFSLERAKRVIAQIGEALLDAQKVGVVHRDLSAKNVLISRDDQVKLINFAVARPIHETLFGVPEFMSPEQAEGKLIDQRSNTYSVGALLYLMLTGQPPFVGATPQATLEAVMKADLIPPSIKRGGGLTTEVDRVVLKALERSSSRRPLTMRQFLSDVSALIVTEEQSAAAGAGTGVREAAFAKTMMFAGGAPEVQKLVAQAVAARQASEAAAAQPAPAAQPVTPVASSRGATPSPLAAPPARDASGPAFRTPSPTGGRPSHGAAVSATMISMPVSGPIAAEGPPAGNPRPSSGETLGPVPPGHSPTSFRETLWFKKGDVDQMVADARAKVAAIVDAKKAAEAAEAVPAVAGEESKPLEERYTDDGTVTASDRKNFSLGSGGTSVGTRGGTVPGERMSDSDVLDEIGGGKRFLIIGIAVAVVVALVAVVVVYVRGKGHHEAEQARVPAPPAAPAAPAAEKAPPPTTPAEAPKAQTPPATKEPAAEGKEADEAPPAPPVAKKAAPAARHHAAAKKRPAPAKKHK